MSDCYKSSQRLRRTSRLRQVFSCKHCRGDFDTKFDFVNHLISHLFNVDKDDANYYALSQDLLSNIASVTNLHVFTNRIKKKLEKGQVVYRFEYSVKDIFCKKCKLKFEDDTVLFLHNKLQHTQVSKRDLLSSSTESQSSLVSLFECDLCDEVFVNLDQLEQHCCAGEVNNQSMKHQQHTPEAVMLPDEFTPVQVVIPVTNHDDEKNCSQSKQMFKRYLCNICRMIVLSPKICHYHLLRHKPDHIVPGATNACPICRRRIAFPDTVSLSNHIVSDHTETTLFSDCGDFSENTKNTKSEFWQDFLCEICGRAFVFYLHYENHVMRHRNLLNRNRLKQQCSKCSKVFLDSRGLSLHLLYQKCSKNTKDASRHGKSTSKESLENLLPLRCLYCQEAFPNAQKLGKHVKRLHKKFIKGKKFLCKDESCWKLFSGYGNFAKHYRSYHIFNEECRICAKNFSCPNKYKLHLTRHSLALLECTYCRKAVYMTSSLNSHVKKKHQYSERLVRRILKRAKSKWLRKDMCLKPLARMGSLLCKSTTYIPSPLSSQSLLENNQASVFNTFKSTANESTKLHNNVTMSADNTKLSFCGTLQLGQYQLPVYQLPIGSIHKFQLQEVLGVEISGAAFMEGGSPGGSGMVQQRETSVTSTNE